MTQAQATLKLRFADRFQLYIENRSYEINLRSLRFRFSVRRVFLRDSGIVLAK